MSFFEEAMTKGSNVIPPYARAAIRGLTNPATIRAITDAYETGKWAYSKFSKKGTSKRRYAGRPLLKALKARKRAKRKRSMKCTVKKLCKWVKHHTAVHEHRMRESAAIQSAHKACNLGCYSLGGTVANIQSALAELKFWRASDNTVVKVDQNVGGFQRDFNISVYRRCHVQNNYHVPCYLEVYSCTPKTDTDIDPLTAYNNGIDDQNLGAAGDQVQPLVRFRDSEELGLLWTCKKVGAKRLNPGQYMTAKSYTKEFRYSPNLEDDQKDIFQKRFAGHCWVVRIVGVLSHDSVTPTQGISQAGADLLFDAEYRIRYDGGKDMHNISISDNSDATVNNAIVSNQPLAAQQRYLVT